ncbi:unnamed protein product [Prunus armeniaca]|uniref:Uncharacterized protein n=1 Tax=Prunus armeniaca TaxID=36596 RepID=A0A6J5XP95_PRUAR|nr:unnamed protein product [Prunus armeniaca]
MRNWERPQSAGHGTSTSLSMSLSPSGQGSWTPSKTLTPRNPERHQRSHASNVQPKITPLVSYGRLSNPGSVIVRQLLELALELAPSFPYASHFGSPGVGNVAQKDRVDGWKKMKQDKIVIRMSTGHATLDPASPTIPSLRD